MNILLPMAGKGRRFAEAGYDDPKPFIPVLGVQMWHRVVQNLPLGHLHVITPADVGETEGAACTALTRAEDIDNDEPLLIANCDQLVEWDADRFVELGTTGHADGAIAIFDCPERDPKWSYVKQMEGGWVHEVVEKQPVSDLATCGIYLWKRGSDFVKYARMMIEADDRVNGEFYIAPVYNYAIRDGMNFAAYRVRRMLGMGTPEDLKATIEVLEREA